MLAKSLAVCVAVLGAAALVLADPRLAYPHCATVDTSKCCALTKVELMAHHGYFLASVDGNATVVTCQAGTLECHLGNPGKQATDVDYPKVPCPEFKKIFESRSGLEVLEGVQYAEPPPQEPLGQVKAADI